MRVLLRGLRVLLVALLVSVPASVALAVGAPVARATTIHPITYLLTPARLETGSCLAMSASGAPAMASCAFPATSAPQRFNLRAEPGTGDVWVASNGTSRCVAASGYTDVVRAPCSSDAASIWVLRWVDEITLQLMNRATGLCLSTGSGWLAPPVQQRCSLAGQWFAVPIGAKYQFRPTHTFKCLDIWNNDGGLQATDPAQQWTCLGVNQLNQLWDLELVALPRWTVPYGTWRVSPPMYDLHPMHNEAMCLAHDQRYDDGYRVHQGSCGAGSAWYLYPLDLSPGNERFQVRAETAHAIDHQVCLDVDLGGGTNDGAKVQVWRCLDAGQTNQVWQPVMLFP